MNKGLSIILGFVSISPILFAFLLVPILEANKPINASQEELKIFHLMFKQILWALWAWCILIIIGFCRYAIKSERIDDKKRNLWVALLVLGNFITLPFFWYWYMRPQRTNTK